LGKKKKKKRDLPKFSEKGQGVSEIEGGRKKKRGERPFADLEQKGENHIQKKKSSSTEEGEREGTPEYFPKRKKIIKKGKKGRKRRLCEEGRESVTGGGWSGGKKRGQNQFRGRVGFGERVLFFRGSLLHSWGGKKRRLGKEEKTLF